MLTLSTSFFRINQMFCCHDLRESAEKLKSGGGWGIQTTYLNMSKHKIVFFFLLILSLLISQADISSETALKSITKQH